MGAEMRLLIVVVTALCLTTVGYATVGTSTYYTSPYVPSSCYGFQDSGKMIAAASHSIWDNSAACGRMYSVTCTGATNHGDKHPCTGQSVVVKIVDYCPPPGCQGTLDLSEEAFIVIANTDAGKIKVDYTLL